MRSSPEAALHVAPCPSVCPSFAAIFLEIGKPYCVCRHFLLPNFMWPFPFRIFRGFFLQNILACFLAHVVCVTRWSGDWELRIMHGSQHIEGSPFSVRVFEPAPPTVRVYGLEDRKMVGRLANFSSKCTNRIAMVFLEQTIFNLWCPLLPYGYSYKASCARTG